MHEVRAATAKVGGGGVVGTLRLATALLIALIALAGLVVFEALSPAEAQAPVAVTVAFEASTYTVAESDGSSTTDVTENAVEVKVILSADPLREVIIPITRTNQGGATDSDYSGVPTSVTFASGDTEKTFTFSATADTDDDDEDKVKLSFGTLPAGVTAGATAETTVSITDDDDPQVTVSFGAATYTAYENNSVRVFVNLSADPERDLSIPLTRTLQGGVTAGDFESPTSVEFLDGDVESSISFRTEPDTDADHGESVLLGFGTLPPGVTLGDTTTTTVTIIDPTSPDPCHSPEIASVGGDGSRWNVLWVWKSSPRDHGCHTDVRIYYTDDYGGTYTEAAVLREYLKPAGWEFRHSLQVPEMSMVSGVRVSVGCNSEGANCAHTLDSTTKSFHPIYSSIGENRKAGPNTKAWLVPTNMAANFGNASVGGFLDIGEDPPDTYRITMTAGVTYTFDEHYRKWAMTSGEWRGAEHFYLPDGFRISLFTKNGAGQLEPVSDFQNQPEHGWQALFRDPDFQIHPYELTFDIVSWDQYFIVVRELSALFPVAHLFPPGQQYRTMCEVAEARGVAQNICGEDLDITKDDGRQLRTASYTPTESGVYYLQVTRVHDDGPVWGQGLKTALIDSQHGTCCNVFVTELSNDSLARWYIPLAGYDTDDSGGSHPTVDDVDENDTPTHMPMLNESNSSKGLYAAFPYYELSVEVTVPEQGSPQQAVNIPAANTPATGGPGIDGSLRAGETLTASTSGIADEDGISGAVFAYQWIRHDLPTATDADIAGTTGSTYTVTTADEGRGLKVRVSFTDDAGNEESLTSFAVIISPPLVIPDDEPANTPATGSPGIDGSPVVGQTLTATTSDIGDDDGLTNATFSYQWLADDAVIEGASASTYTVAAGDVGKTIKVRVAFTDDVGNEESLTSAGTAAVQQPLTADIHDAPESHDGSAAFTFELRFSETPREDFSYVTLRDHAFAVTGGAVANVRRLEPGKNVRWEITVQPSGDADVTLSLPVTTDCASQGAICTGDGRMLSAEVEVTVSGPGSQQSSQENSAATGAPTISGTAQVGDSLTADTSGIADADGLTSATFAYRWLADDAEISGATGSSYTLTSSEQGKTIKVRVAFTDDAGNAESLTSDATAAVAARPNSAATGAPTISGTAQVGETLTAATSGIRDDDGIAKAVFAYQWVAGESDINGATGSSYTLTSSEQGKAIKVRVTFTDDAGNEESLTSAATATVAAAPSPLTASVHNTPTSHDGQSAFTFELRFSETPRDDFSYRTLRDHAFTMTGGEVTNAGRLEPGKNIRWEITVRPDGNAGVTIILPVTTDCAAEGAICTGDGRMLSTRLELAVSGPGG